jgi:hypothetical protein
MESLKQTSYFLSFEIHTKRSSQETSATELRKNLLQTQQLKTPILSGLTKKGSLAFRIFPKFLTASLQVYLVLEKPILSHLLSINFCMLILKGRFTSLIFKRDH